MSQKKEEKQSQIAQIAKKKKKGKGKRRKPNGSVCLSAIAGQTSLDTWIART